MRYAAHVMVETIDDALRDGYWPLPSPILLETVAGSLPTNWLTYLSDRRRLGPGDRTLLLEIREHFSTIFAKEDDKAYHRAMGGTMEDED